jgi:hypothetical protein
MIEEIPGRPDGTLEFKITGRVTSDDYEKTLTPAIERALEQHDRIRVLIQIGPGFEGYGLDAAWDDARLGLKHWRGFDRVAVVTDVGWLKVSVKAFSFAMPCPVQTFDLSELDDARRWLGESLGALHVNPLGGDVLAIRLIGKLEASAYERATGEIDEFIGKHGRIRLLVDLREFDGWQGLAGLGEHLSLVRDHHRAPQRVAVVGDAEWQRLALRVFSRFLNADARYFDEDDIAAAEAWLKEGQAA